MRLYNVKLHRKMWSNWSKQFTSCPVKRYSPSTVDEISQIIRQAKEDNVDVRAVGQGHSFSPITSTNGYMVHTDNLNHIELGPILDSNKYGSVNHTVRCQAGVDIETVNNFLDRHDLIIGSNVVLTCVRMGGIVSTGSHGTGMNYSTISDRVYEIRIVDSDGNLRTYNEDTTDPQVMSAVRLSMGTFGIVYDVVLRVEKATNVHTTSRIVGYNDIFNVTAFKKLFETKEWLEFYIFPFSSKVLTKESVRTQQKISWLRKKWLYFTYIIDSLISLCLAIIANIVFQTFPNVLHYAGKNNFLFFFPFDRVQSLRYAVHYSTFIEHSLPVYNPECCVGFNADEAGYKKILSCIDTVIKMNESYYRRGMAPCILGINVRFTKRSDCLISSANIDSDYVMWIETLLGPKSKGYKQFCVEFNSRMIQDYQGLAHWAKSWYETPISDITKNNKDKLKQFLHIRSELGVDPTNMFVNPTLKYIFDSVTEKW
jgi:hypothetical protein